MIAPQALLRAFDPTTYDAIQAFKVVDPTLMPLAYQNIPGGRPLHDDWAIWSDTPRIGTAYRVPAPLKLISGDNAPQWMLWDPSYPQSPGLVIETRPIGLSTGQVYNLPHALIDCAVENSGYATFAVWLGGKWVPCFQSYRKSIFGRNYAQYTGGLKIDVTVSPNADGSIKSDIMGWWDPPSVSYTKGA